MWIPLPLIAAYHNVLGTEHLDMKNTMEKKSIHKTTLQNLIREIRKMTWTQMPLTLLSIFLFFEIFILFLKF